MTVFALSTVIWFDAAPIDVSDPPSALNVAGSANVRAPVTSCAITISISAAYGAAGMLEMKQAGAWVFSGGLHDASTATVVQHKGDQTLVTDGPYVEGKEHLGGFTIVRAADLDGALEWARKTARIIPLPIEVRPFKDDRDH